PEGHAQSWDRDVPALHRATGSSIVRTNRFPWPARSRAPIGGSPRQTERTRSSMTVRLVLASVAVGLAGFFAMVVKAVNPPGAPADHFLCYRVKDAGDPKFTKLIGISLLDEFQSNLVDVIKPE